MTTEGKTGAKSAIAAYCANIGEFFNGGGCLVFGGQDQHFMPVVSQLMDQAGIGEKNLFQRQGDEEFFQIINDSLTSGKRVFAVLEYLQPKNRGLSLAKRLKEKHPDLPAIILASSENRNVRALFSEFGCDNVIVKPVNVNSLMILISDILAAPSAESILLRKAMELAQKRSWDKAIAITKVIERAKPASAGNYMAMGDIFAMKGDYEKAALCYGHASEANPALVRPYVKAAEAARKAGDLEKELETLARLDIISPFNAERKIRIGEIHLENGDAAAAMNFLNAAIPYLDSAASEKAQKLALDLATSCGSDYPQVEKALRHSLNLKKGVFDEGDAKLFSLLETALLKQGKKARAVKESGKALDILPDSPELHYNFARLMFENGDIETGKSHLLKILAEHNAFVGKSADTAFNCGWMLMKAGSDREALSCFQKCVALDPARRQAAQFMAQIEERIKLME